MNDSSNLKDIAKLFIKLGFTAFGGPAAHIAMMQQEVVIKRKWLTENEFLDLLGATNLIPGPNSTEMAIHIGHEKGGWKGLIIAGMCFILPAVFITGIFAWFYKQYGQLPEAQSLIYGIKPAIISIIIMAVVPLAKKSLKSKTLYFFGALALILSLLKVSELIIMFGLGFLALGKTLILEKSIKNKGYSIALFPVLGNISNTKIFFIFLKIGSILYGSGYVLFAFLNTELVETGIMSKQVLIDAIAVGQFTPGPVFSSVTFIGYQINSLSGAICATLGIFLPSFLFVAALNPLVKKMRNSTLMSAFLDAVNVASVGLIFAVSIDMAKDSIMDWRTIAIAVLSFLLLLKYKNLNSAWIVLGGAVLGYLFSLIS